MLRSTWTTLLCIGAVSIVPAAVRAQESPSASQPSRSPGATEGRRHFEQAEALFRRGNYEAAIGEYDRAYELLAENPTRYVILFNIGQSHERLFRYDDALRYYRRYLAEGGPEAEDRATVEATMRALEGLLATVRIATNVRGAEVWVDERRVGAAPGELRIPGGRHLLELRARGYEPARRELQIAARTRTELRIDLDALSRQKGISPVFFWVGAGVSLAAAGVGAIFGTMALSARSDVDARLADPLRRWEVSEADRSEIDDLALAADLLFGTAALFAVGTGILFFMTDWGDGDEERATPSVALSRDGASVLVRGAFE